MLDTVHEEINGILFHCSGLYWDGYSVFYYVYQIHQLYAEQFALHYHGYSKLFQASHCLEGSENFLVSAGCSARLIFLLLMLCSGRGNESHHLLYMILKPPINVILVVLSSKWCRRS